MGKLLEKMILQRLQDHIVHENGLSENQFRFRKGRSTVDVIQAVVDIATKARRGTGKRKGFCALISIDIRNAFNTAIWNWGSMIVCGGQSVGPWSSFCCFDQDIAFRNVGRISHLLLLKFRHIESINKKRNFRQNIRLKLLPYYIYIYVVF